jgi:hypothetical protein
MKKAIDHDTLEALVSDSALHEVRVGTGRRRMVATRPFGLGWRPVRSRREPVRLWASLTALRKFCDNVGIKTLTVEL